MVGRLEQWLPVTGHVAFFAAAPADVARALKAQLEQWEARAAVEELDDPFPDALRRLEPIDGKRMLLAGGGDWTALFQASAQPDLGSEWSTLTKRLRVRSVLATALPNLYGRGKGANTMLRYADPSAGDAVRWLQLSYDSRWTFSADGPPQAWEDQAAYEAPRAVDRLPPSLVNAYLDAIGIPPLDGPAWGSGALLVTESAPPPEPTRRGLLGRRRADPAPPPKRPVAQTIAELHERMYGD
jgi:hypothetical protein